MYFNINLIIKIIFCMVIFVCFTVRKRKELFNLEKKNKINIKKEKLKQKVFLIGFNKTGTSTYHHMLKKYIKSSHETTWTSISKSRDDLHFYNYFKNYDAYSDGETPDFRNLYSKYPNAKFILNTRNINKWLYSRIKHIYANYPNFRNSSLDIDWNINKDKDKGIKSWIFKRNNYYYDLFNFFKGKDNFLMIDIEDENMLDKLNNFLNFNIKEIKMKNSNSDVMYKNKEYWENKINNVLQNDKNIVGMKRFLPNIKFINIGNFNDETIKLLFNLNNLEFNKYKTTNYILWIMNPIDRFVIAFKYAISLSKNNKNKMNNFFSKIKKFTSIEDFINKLEKKNKIAINIIDFIYNKEGPYFFKGLKYYFDLFSLTYQNIFYVGTSHTADEDINKLEVLFEKSQSEYKVKNQEKININNRSILKKYLKPDLEIIKNLKYNKLLSKKKYNKLTKI
jgi:hypothetical protein